MSGKASSGRRMSWVVCPALAAAAVLTLATPRGAHGSAPAWGPMGEGVDLVAGPSGWTPAVNAVATGAGGQVYAGGIFDRSGATVVNAVARWTGTQWVPLCGGLPSGDFVDALAVDGAGAIYAGGFTRQGWPWPGWVRRCSGPDGTSWTSLGGAGAPERHVRTLLVDGASVIAGGDFAGHVKRWNGAGWSLLGCGARTDVFNAPADYSSTYALAVASDGTVFAGGWYQGLARCAPGANAWESIVPAYTDPSRIISDFDAVYELAIIGGQLHAAGSSAMSRGDAGSGLVARWTGSGTTWQQVGADFQGGLDTGTRPSSCYSGELFALTGGDGGALVTGGSFTRSGARGAPPCSGSPGLNAVSIWGGTAWDPLGSGLTAPDGARIYSLAWSAATGLIAGGTFAGAGGVPAANVARWGIGPPPTPGPAPGPDPPLPVPAGPAAGESSPPRDADAGQTRSRDPVRSRERVPIRVVSQSVVPGLVTQAVRVSGAGRLRLEGLSISQPGGPRSSGRVRIDNRSRRACSSVRPVRRAGVVRISCAPARPGQAGVTRGPMRVLLVTAFTPVAGARSVVRRAVTIPHLAVRAPRVAG